VHECTRPEDSVLVTWFAPDVYFFSGRGIGGGQIMWFSGYPGAGEQLKTVERLKRTSVPVALMHVPRDREFKKNFRPIHDYLSEQYVVAGESGFGGNDMFRVLVDKRLTPVSTHEASSLPCFVQRA
jgi:hypothetical protein